MSADAQFTDCLQAKLTLTISDTDHVVNAGAIMAIDLDAQTYGFDASATFAISCDLEDDPLLESFNGSEPVWASLELANGRLAMAGKTPVSQKWAGWAVERSFVETIGPTIDGSPVVRRVYTVRFVDPARALWTCHRPLSLHAGDSIRTVLDANCVEGMSLAFDWPELEAPVDLFCVGLGSASAASFYDFVAWLLADRNGVIELDPATGSYRIAHTKSSGTPFELSRASVSAAHVHIPGWKRHAAVVVNPFSEATSARETVDNDLSATGVREDIVCHTQIPKETDARVRLERDRLRQPCHRATLVLRALPDALPAPATSITLGDGFSESEYLSGTPMRLRAVRLTARNCQDPVPADEAESAQVPFRCEAAWEAEMEGDACPHLPAYVAPAYPLFVEGKVLSASGLAADRTWHAAAHEGDSQFDYRVMIPLWNKIIRVPFTSAGQPGHFFFPAAKDQRVLVALGVDKGRIVNFLDWMAKLDNDSQGNQIAMGKRAESRTVLRHRYTDESPEFLLARTQWGDMQTLQLSEGRFFLEVKEDEQVTQPTETYDLSPQADAAKDAASGEARNSVGDLSASFGKSFGETKGALDTAKADLQDSVKETATNLNGKIGKTRAALAEKSAEIESLGDDLNTPFAKAEAALADLGID
jgi:hypothetical protein